MIRIVARANLSPTRDSVAEFDPKYWLVRSSQ
jgi:hypothetical protein